MRRTVRGLTLSLAMIALAGTGCGLPQPNGMPATPAAAASPTPTGEQVRNATIIGVYANPVSLRNGVYEGPPFAEGGASRPRLLLIQNLLAFGNLDGVAGDEVAVLLAESSGGSGERIYLSVIGLRDGAPVSLSTIGVGDRTKIRSFVISGADIVIHVIEAGPIDPACCPTQVGRKTYGMGAGHLTLRSSVVTGTLSVALLAGAQWRVLAIDGQPLPDGPRPPTATVEGDRIAGFGGCNRYTATIKETSPGDIAVGPIASTRMACPGPEMQLEDRFLASLGKVTRYTFQAGQLLVSSMEGSTLRSVLLTRD